ncbi:hypothetical protein MRB53_003521 [Persea americana]|uniref:Uncharacterized protein n=1 Tax=Persea americana TaxID=3435 RepID=A0ACC2MXW6_PERAE|nr:hypothetical protein MRB53_003521 [Persea americana]
MAMEALASCNDLSNFIVHETISATENHYNASQTLPTSLLFESKVTHFMSNYPHFNGSNLFEIGGKSESSSLPMLGRFETSESKEMGLNSTTQGRKKRRRKPRVCKNQEEAETQRMTHITVERNRRRLMNEHLAVLRSLMPDSYIQRGDQASIVGGAIDFVKELEQLLQSLEAQKRMLVQQQQQRENKSNGNIESLAPPFAQFFTYPQFLWCQIHGDRENPNETRRAVADIEVTMIETHANLKILSIKRPRQIIRMLAGFQTLHLPILHLNVTTLDPFVLYSISAKVEEGCHLNSADEVAAAVHHMFTIIADEAALRCEEEDAATDS